MRRLLGFIVLSVCAFMAVGKTSAPAPSAPVQVVQAQFGLFNVLPNGDTEFVPATQVPLKVDQSYGWVVKVKTAQDTVRWREEFSLPAAPTTWRAGPNDRQKLTADRKVSVIEREVRHEGGMIVNAWTVAKGDPPGPYVIRLKVENEPPVVFKFRVE